MQRVAVLRDLVPSNERTAAVRCCVWVMSSNGKVGEKETLAVRKSVDPCQYSCNCGRFVDPETRIIVAADFTGVFQSLVTTVANDRLHAQIAEASRVEHGRAVTGACQNLCQRMAMYFPILLWFGVECRKFGTQH